jgi:anaerobic magnesium-protoporphyrin IX monomethyl ester cyclase
LIAGLPEEDYQSFRKTFNDVFALRPEELQLGFLKMLRGTGVRARAANHGYIYMDEAPYEILANNVLSFDDVLKIKRVEDILEKYWNAHRMDYTLEWIVSRYFETPFDFFQSFGDFWEQQGWNRIGHQLEDLFTRLQVFLEHRQVAELEHAVSLMKFDYLRNQKYRPRKLWWEDVQEKREIQAIFQEVQHQRERLRDDFALHAANEKEYFKHTVASRISFDIEHWLQSAEVAAGDYALVVYYPYEPNKENSFVVVKRSEAFVG